MVYIVTFEVNSQQTDNQLRALLKTYSAYCPIHPNCWAVITDKKAAEVRDHLMGVLKSGDYLFVIRSGTEAAWNTTYNTENSQWLQKNL